MSTRPICGRRAAAATATTWCGGCIATNWTGGGHADLLTALRGLAGMVVLSGYPDPMYDDMLPDWRRVTCVALADGARERTEVLWISPRCAAALDARDRAVVPSLFDRVAP